MKKSIFFTSLLVMFLFSSCSKEETTNTPPEEDNVLTAQFLNGVYYEDDYAPGVGNYWFFLSDNGFDSNEEFLPESFYFRIDLYGPMTNDPQFKIPDGVYLYDKHNTGGEFTFSEEYSLMIETDKNGSQIKYYFDDAQLIVEGDKITLLTTIGDKDYTIIYEGDYSLKDDREDNPNPPSDDTSYSTLTSDLEVNFVNANARADYAGDWWQCGFANWTIYIMSKEYDMLHGDTILIDFITASADHSGSIAGIYTCGNTPGANVLMNGIVQYSMPIGSWYFKYQNESIVSQAPLMNGSLTITENGDGTYSFSLDCFDDASTPNRITANWSGEVRFDGVPSMATAKNFVEYRSFPLEKR